MTGVEDTTTEVLDRTVVDQTGRKLLSTDGDFSPDAPCPPLCLWTSAMLWLSVIPDGSKMSEGMLCEAVPNILEKSGR